MLDLFDDANHRTLQANTKWVARLFRSHQAFESSYTGTEWVYVFIDAVLNTPLLGEGGGGGALCGDNGGRTTKGAPCKKKAVDGGRCRQHPRVADHAPGDAVARAEVRFGPDVDDRRPVPVTLGWSECTVTVDGRAHGLPALADDTLAMTPAMWVWGDVINDWSDAIELPPDGTLVVDGRAYAVRSGWDVTELHRRHRQLPPLEVDGRPLAPGHRLEDYGVRFEGSPVHAKICGRLQE